MKSHLVDIEVVCVARTEKAILVQLDVDAPKVWLPLSQIEVDGEKEDTRGTVVVTMPERLAQEKGLI